MKTFLTALAALFALATTTLAQDHQAIQRAAADLVSRVNSLEERLTVQDDRLTTLERLVRATREVPRQASEKPTYQEAVARAFAENKPLVVWSGSAVCPACVHETSDEFVSYVGDVKGLQTDALTVGFPEGPGDMPRVATITTWVTGDQTFGHVPSIRRAVQKWRQNRQKTEPTMTASASYQQAPPMMMMGSGPTMMVGGGGMMGMGSGGCASCGGGGGGRGIFGRR